MPPPASITIHESVVIPAPPEVVWTKITDPHFVVLCVPGAQVLSETPDGQIEGALQVKLGPTVVDFRGTAVPTYEPDAHRGALAAQGTDKSGRSRAQAHLTFVVEAAGADASEVTFDGTIELAGGLASFLQTGGVHLTKRMMKDFSDQMSARIVHAEASVAAAADDSATAPPPPPVNKPISGLRMLALTIWDMVRSLFRRKSKV
jgi:carbon monoxide dehydrogenase subunit G